MARLSPAERASATTTRYVGCFVAPTRVSRILTAMCPVFLLVAAGRWGDRPVERAGTASVRRDDRDAPIERAVLAAGADQRVERLEIGLDLAGVVGPRVGRHGLL